MRLALSNGSRKYADLSENGPAIVSRGRLIGALLLGPKRSQESYAPDESSAIEDLAHHVGAVLDVLGHTTSAEEPVVTELKAMHRAIADGFASLQAKLERS